MAGQASNIGWIAIGKQSAKGTAASVPTIKLPVRSGGVGPQKRIGRYATTDIGRDRGPEYVSGVAVSGGWECYMEPAAMGLLWYLVLGANADSGAGPFVHTGTPANDLPYCTIWDSTGSTPLVEKFTDVKIGSMTIAGSAGEPWICSIGDVMGLTATYGDTAGDALTILSPAGYLFPEVFAAVKFDTVAQAVSRLEIGVTNGVSPYQADGYLYTDIDPGQREVTLAFDTRWGGPTAFPDYKTYYYGAGTTLVTTAPATHAFQVIITRSASLKQQIDMPQVKYVIARPVKDAGGDPLAITVAGDVEKPSGSSIVTVASTDSAATV